MVLPKGNVYNPSNIFMNENNIYLVNSYGLGQPWPAADSGTWAGLVTLDADFAPSYREDWRPNPVEPYLEEPTYLVHPDQYPAGVVLWLVG